MFSSILDPTLKLKALNPNIQNPETLSLWGLDRVEGLGLQRVYEAAIRSPLRVSEEFDDGVSGFRVQPECWWFDRFPVEKFFWAGQALHCAGLAAS